MPKPKPETIHSFVPPVMNAGEYAAITGEVRNYGSEREWLIARLMGIGASEVPGILGMSRYQGPFSIWRRKVTQIGEEAGSRSPEAEAGHRHESTIAKWFEDVCDCEHLPKGQWYVDDPGEYCTVWRPPLFCTPDRFVRHVDGNRLLALLEAKCAWYKQAVRFGDALPIEYRVQVQTQMHCTGLRVAYYGVLLHGLDFRWYREVYHEGLVTQILRWVGGFWRYVENKTPPPADYSESTRQALAAHYDQPEDTEVELPDEFQHIHEQLVAAKGKQEAAGKARRAAENRIKAELGNNVLGVLPRGDLGYSWRPNKKGVRTLRVETIRREHE